MCGWFLGWSMSFVCLLIGVDAAEAVHFFARRFGTEVPALEAAAASSKSATENGDGKKTVKSTRADCLCVKLRVPWRSLFVLLLAFVGMIVGLSLDNSPERLGWYAAEFFAPFGAVRLAVDVVFTLWQGFEVVAVKALQSASARQSGCCPEGARCQS